MNTALNVIQDMEEAVRQLREAAAAKKCWSCGCLHSSLEAIERAIPAERRAPPLDLAICSGRQRLSPVRYDCLGCEVCYPALAMNALNIDGEACPTEKVERCQGWPPLPGSYHVLRYRAPVAVCTLTDEQLAHDVVRQATEALAIVGWMYTENLGIERLIQNVLGNPNIRFLIVCGADSKQAIGHLPGQSLVSLARNGIDEHGRIIGAKGKRPVLRNISRETVEHFRRTIRVVDLIGTSDVDAVAAAVMTCSQSNPGPAEPYTTMQTVIRMQGYLPERMVSDPRGYFVIYLDREHGRISMEHYASSGVLDTVIEGRTAAEVYMPAIDRGLVSRLDHAAYLGKELARAERALIAGEPYVQDAAPQRQMRVSCCDSSWERSKP